MKITWSIPVRGERLEAPRGDLVRARHLIEALRADGHDVCVVEDARHRGSAFIVSTHRRLVRGALPRKISWVLRDFGRWMHAWRHGLHVATAARKQGAALIIETQVGFAASGSLAARLTRLPLVLDDCSPSSEESALGAGLPALARYLLGQQTRAATSVVAVSKAMREVLIAEGVPRHRVCLVPNGIDRGAFQPRDSERQRDKLGLSQRFVVGFVGSFQPWHQVDLLVQAAAHLIRKHEIHLLLVGDGPELASTIGLVRRLGLVEHVTTLGPRPAAQVPQVVSAFDVGVLPGSNHYGHPMKLLEYAAAAIPSVAPDLAPVREVLQPEVTGLLFRPGDVDGLASCLSRLAEDAALRERLGRSARRLTLAGASWTERARALLAAPAHLLRAPEETLSRLPAPGGLRFHRRD